MGPATRQRRTRSDDGTMRPSPPGSAASTATGSPRCGRAMGADHGSAMGLTRSSASWRNGRELLSADQDGTATWSLSLLQKALRKAPDGLPKVSPFTIWRTLHEAGLSWQKSRTWCETGVVMRKRKPGVVRVRDPDAAVKRG